MTKMSDVAVPSLLITEGTEPSAPAAGKQRLYIDSTTHKLKRTDSSGTDVTIEGSSTTIATDTIWDAKGDIVGASAADTGGRLAVGSNGQVLTADSAQSLGIKWASATGAPVVDTIVQQVDNAFTSGTSIVLTVVAPSSGNPLVMLVGATGRGANSITQTNVTWTQRLTNNGNSRYCEVWTGVVTGAAGTTATIAFTGSNDCAATFLELASTAPAFTTAGTPRTATAASGTIYTVATASGSTTVLGDYYVWICTAGQASSYSGMNQSFVGLQPFGGYFRCGILRSHGGPLSLWNINVATNAFNMILVKIS